MAVAYAEDVMLMMPISELLDVVTIKRYVFLYVSLCDNNESMYTF